MEEKTEVFKRVASEAKDRQWKSFCDTLNRDTTLTHFWQFYRQMEGCAANTNTPDLIDASGSVLKTSKEKGSALLQRFVQQSNQNNLDERKAVWEGLDRTLTEAGSIDDMITELEFTEALSGLSKDTAPGPDRVKYSDIKNLSVHNKSELFRLYEESFATGQVPEDWSHSYLKPVPKLGKDHSKLNGYRILTMQNTTGKLMERIVARKLAQDLERRNVLPPNQGGYRAGKSTWENAARFAYDVYEGFQRKEQTLAVAIDLEDAYNRVQFKLLMELLRQYGVSLTLTRWLAAALQERKVAMRLGNWISTPQQLTMGLPQGSPLSPVLYNVNTKGLADLNSNGLSRVLTLADDGLIYKTSSDISTAVTAVQEQLEKVSHWCHETESEINPSKAQALWCTLNNKAVGQAMPAVSFNGEAIERTNSLRYLGIHFDRMLTYKTQVESTKLRCKKGLSALKAMASKGIEQRHLFLLYQSVILSVIDYGLGLTTLSQSNLLKLDRVQNEAMRVILGTTKDTPIETMRYLLDLPSMETRHKVEQVKAYLNAMQNPKNPLHDAVKEEKGCRLARGKSWMGQAEQSIQRVCSLTELKQVRDWEKHPLEFKPYYKTLLSENLGTHCREWPAGKTNAEVQMLVEANSKPHDLVIYTDGSVTRDRSGWGFTVKQDGRTVHEDSGAHRVTTSSLTMEVEAVTHAIQWLASQRDAQITHAIILTDSMNLLQKVESGMGCPDWHTAMHSLRLERLLWIYCPGHPGVSGNERADRLASTADITSGLQLGRAEVLRGLRNFLSTDKPEHHSIDRLKERGVEKRSGRHSTLQGRERSVFNQTNIGTVSRTTLGRLLRDGAERVWAFPSATMPS